MWAVMCVCHHVCHAQARSCLSTGWALNRCFAWFFGTAAVLAQGGGRVVFVDVRCPSLCLHHIHPPPDLSCADSLQEHASQDSNVEAPVCCVCAHACGRAAADALSHVHLLEDDNGSGGALLSCGRHPNGAGGVHAPPLHNAIQADSSEGRNGRRGEAEGAACRRRWRMLGGVTGRGQWIWGVHVGGCAEGVRGEGCAEGVRGGRVC